jgi:hypothetical protein
VTTTEYERDDDGRVIRAITTTEPRWTEIDRAEALALALYRSGLCPCGCGNKVTQTLVPEADGPAWEVHEISCTARMALLEVQNAVRESPSRAKYLPASLWLVRPRKG